LTCRTQDKELKMSQQADWRFCQKCQALFFDGFPDKGHCIAGGGHLSQGFNFNLPYDIAESASAQAAWRFCSKCYEMYYGGLPDNGHCSGGGGHTAQGFNFTLPHDIAENANAQSAWRFCQACHAMFYDGFAAKGQCPGQTTFGPRGPVHEGHVASGFNFVLPHDTQSPAAGDALQLSFTGPLWMLSLNYQQAEDVRGVLPAIGGAAVAVPAAGPAITAACAAAAGIIQFMNSLSGGQGVEVQGLLGATGVVVTPRGSGFYQTLVAGAYAVGGVATIADFLLKAGGQVQTIAAGLGIGTAAKVYSSVAGGTPLGWAIVFALGGIVKLLQPAPDPNEHGGIHADRIAAGDWERFIMMQIPPGQQIALLSWQGLFSAQNGGGADVYANRVKLDKWETWNFVDNHDSTVSLQTIDGHYLTATNGGGDDSYCKADSTAIGTWERFYLENQPGGHIALKTHDKGTYLSVQSGK
jgi:hypothetical protein